MVAGFELDVTQEVLTEALPRAGYWCDAQPRKLEVLRRLAPWQASCIRRPTWKPDRWRDSSRSHTIQTISATGIGTSQVRHKIADSWIPTDSCGPPWTSLISLRSNWCAVKATILHRGVVACGVSDIKAAALNRLANSA